MSEAGKHYAIICSQRQQPIAQVSAARCATSLPNIMATKSAGTRFGHGEASSTFFITPVSTCCSRFSKIGAIVALHAADL